MYLGMRSILSFCTELWRLRRVIFLLETEVTEWLRLNLDQTLIELFLPMSSVRRHYAVDLHGPLYDIDIE